MKKIVFGHKNPDTDSICSAIAYSLSEQSKGVECTPYRLGKLNKETEFILKTLNIEVPKLLEEANLEDEVVLVDHNESSQSISNIKDLNVVEVYDHHRLGDFETANPIRIDIRPVGCTSTVLYTKFKNEGYDIDKTMASLMLSAIISDTLMFKSPTCTKEDKLAAKELKNISGLDMKEYGMSLLKSGTDLSDLSTAELLEVDTKSFDILDYTYEIGQINTADIQEVKDVRDEELRVEIGKRIEEKKLDSFIFVITDIVNSNSLVYVMGPNKDLVAKDFNQVLENDTMFLEGVVSRKKQVVPFLGKGGVC